jgi:hypothetical protein
LYNTKKDSVRRTGTDAAAQNARNELEYSQQYTASTKDTGFVVHKPRK